MATKSVSAKAKAGKAPAKKTPSRASSARGARSGKSEVAQSCGKAVIGRPFQKGQSGNPGGRPRIPEEVRDACRALTMEMIETLRTVARGGKTVPAAARVMAANSILDRGWGKPTQPVSGEDGKPIEVATIIRRIVDEAPNAG